MVTHPDIYPAQLDLTSVVKGEPVLSFRKAVLIKERLDAYKQSSHLVKGSISGELKLLSLSPRWYESYIFSSLNFHYKRM